MNVGQLLDNLRGGVQVQDTLVDAHLEAVPSVGTLTTRGLADQQLQSLGGHSHRSSHLETHVHSLLLELSAQLLHGIDLSGGNSDADSVDCLLFSSLSILKDRDNNIMDLV